MAYKTFVAGEEALAADVNAYLMGQTVARFTNAAQRSSQLAAPAVNQLSSHDDRPGFIERWNGTAWVDASVGRELAYAEITANKSITATTDAAGDLVVGAPATTFDGSTAVVLEFYSPAVVPAQVVAATVLLYLVEASAPTVSLGNLAIVSNPAAGQLYMPVHATRRFTPPAGTKTYNIGAFRQLGNGTVIAGAGGVGGAMPAFVRITRAA